MEKLVTRERVVSVFIHGVTWTHQFFSRAPIRVLVIVDGAENKRVLPTDDMGALQHGAQRSERTGSKSGPSMMCGSEGTQSIIFSSRSTCSTVMPYDFAKSA